MNSDSSDSVIGRDPSASIFVHAKNSLGHNPRCSAFQPPHRMTVARKAAFMRFREKRSETAERKAQTLRNRDITVFCLAAASVTSVALGFTIMKVVTIAAISTVAPYVGVALALFFIIAAERILNKQKQEDEPKLRKTFPGDESDGNLADIEVDTEPEEEPESDSEESDNGQGLGLGSEDPFRETHSSSRRDLLPPPSQDEPLLAPPPQRGDSEVHPQRRRSFHGAHQRQGVDPREISQVAINIRPTRNGFLSTLMIDFTDPANRQILENLLESMQPQPVGRNLELMPLQEQGALALRNDDLEINMLCKGRWYHLQIDPAFREAILARLSHFMPHPMPMRNAHGRELIPMQRPVEEDVDCNGMLAGDFERDCVMVDRADPFKTYVERYCTVPFEVAEQLKNLGFRVIEAIQRGNEVPHEGKPDLQFTAVCWALMYYASRNKQAFFEGTFVLKDKNYRLFNYFLPNMYVRASSHFKRRAIPVKERGGWAHFGLDVEITPDFALPARKRHIMMGKIESFDGRDRIYIKPENWGTNPLRPFHIFGHGVEFVESQGKRRLPWLFGDVGSGDAYQKEHILPDDDITFREIYFDESFPPALKPANENQFWIDYQDFGLEFVVQFLLEISTRKDLPLSISDRVATFLRELRQRYGGSLESRRGNEVAVNLDGSFMDHRHDRGLSSQEEKGSE